MGYPMTYSRVVRRNNLAGDYNPNDNPLALIRGDMRRLEKDSRDEEHLKKYAEIAGVAPYQVKILLDAFFSDQFGRPYTE